MSKHEEFPELTPQARAVYDAAVNAIQNSKATISSADLCRALAACLLEAMKQAALGKVWTWPTNWGNLHIIANNLHNPPPPPPTLAEAREAARQLAGTSAEIVHAFLATLGEGKEP